MKAGDEALNGLYSGVEVGELSLEDLLRQSLNPRAPDTLYTLFGELGVGPDEVVLDVGCGHSNYSIEIFKRFGCFVHGVDPIVKHVEIGQRKIADAGPVVAAKVKTESGAIEALPLDDASVDYIWMRDVLIHIDMLKGFAECKRVLKPGGQMFIYSLFASDLLNPCERERLYGDVIVPENVERESFEAAVHESGLSIALYEDLGSEFIQWRIERGYRQILSDLLRVARMAQLKKQSVDEDFVKAYDASYHTLYNWDLYRLIGKLHDVVYVLRTEP